ncbi:GFA family protein [Pelagibacterium limicola]|uniref:GFA family protein n=1 Tax=Pelagibacterium limicola TaxID=2791022 RepID=UPI0018AF7945|nr:GFA family protein [Pelagibacterium limicola]
MIRFEPMSGGCQCGALRYHIEAALEGPELCHCRMCQKAHGAPAVAWGTIPAAALVWSRGLPAEFRSSDHAVREFCARCGTPLIFRPDGQGTIDIALATLDQPQDIAPEEQYGIDTRMPWFPGAHLLPAKPSPGRGRTFQHPDHDTPTWP